MHYERHHIADVTRPIVITSTIANHVEGGRSHLERVLAVADVFPHPVLRKEINIKIKAVQKEKSNDMHGEQEHQKVDAIDARDHTETAKRRKV